MEEDNELTELRLSEGINVWGTNQRVLEEQALKELEIFAKEQGTKNVDELEDGEVVEDKSAETNKKQDFTLNIESYIKKQEELKKKQERQKFQSVCTHSKELANGVSQKYSHKKKRKKVATDFREKREEIVNTSNTSTSKSINTDNKQILRLSDTSYNLDGNEESGSEYVPSSDELDSDYEPGYEKSTDVVPDTIQNFNKRKRGKCKQKDIEKVKDDGLLSCYKSRLDLFYKKLEEEHSLRKINDEEEVDHLLKGGLKIPIKIWNKLYGYQQDGIKWLWRIHQNLTGGLLGDEMGLGKTVQVIVFLHSLEYSRISSCHGRFTGLGPSLVICPATIIHQWVKHFHEWSPEFRVAVLHQSGSYQGNTTNFIKEIHKCGGIIVTTYLGILKYKASLLEYSWHYIILDEGHKIRNPSAKVTVAVKHFRTPHRLMLTGSPMQNNLTELWSLFDFTNPGMLGNLTTFQEHFANPILQGGFANSTPMQEATALTVATALKNLITTCMLRRSKNEVQHHISLPNKNEQVLFCSLTDEQKDLYKSYLMSEHINSILERATKKWFLEQRSRANILVAITTLRKICNHPDIYKCEAEVGATENDASTQLDEQFGYYKKSGKMVVVSALLKIWKKQKHRVLLFTQTRLMITIFEEFLHQQGYKYLKMDGSTSISSRQSIIDQFNQDTTYDVFLLTTKVGGLGVNLTGANRVIIYDPDWNPATDTQARERAWRIGQEKQVTIYRLISAGTIEEKIYQRQVWKQLLSNKVLLDPKTSRFFKTSDLHDLFSLQESNCDPETTAIFHNSRVRIQEKQKRKGKQKLDTRDKTVSSDVQFSEDKIRTMKNLAQQIAKSLSQKEETTAGKSSYQLWLEEEREKKLKEKEEIKKLSPQQLLHYNREKINQREDETVNKIDGSETDVSFLDALQYSGQIANLHHVLNSGINKDSESIKAKAHSMHKSVSKIKTNDTDSTIYETKKHKKNKNGKSVIDVSGTVDGEQIEGLLKSEIERTKKDKSRNKCDESQDSFVLGKLFSKKGVSGVLQHDGVVQSGYREGSLRIHHEAKARAEKSLEALRKSRLDNWKW